MPASALKTRFQGRGKGPLLGKGRCETQSGTGRCCDQIKRMGEFFPSRERLRVRPHSSVCFASCLECFASLFCPCETLTSIETGPKSCCAHQPAAYPGLGAGSEVLSLLTTPVPPPCPLHLPCPLRHLFLLILTQRLKNSYNLMGNL